jgi:hypothetical protein
MIVPKRKNMTSKGQVIARLGKLNWLADGF